VQTCPALYQTPFFYKDKPAAAKMRLVHQIGYLPRPWTTVVGIKATQYYSASLPSYFTIASPHFTETLQEWFMVSVLGACFSKIARLASHGVLSRLCPFKTSSLTVHELSAAVCLIFE
jgi:hypothetical protein